MGLLHIHKEDHHFERLKRVIFRDVFPKLVLSISRLAIESSDNLTWQTSRRYKSTDLARWHRICDTLVDVFFFFRKNPIIADWAYAVYFTANTSFHWTAFR